MQTNWTIRDEFIYLSQRWMFLVLAFLVGSLLGWGLARLLPTSYEAQTTWSVAVNADAEPRNPDDFKNWQLLQLEAFLFSDSLLADTAARLGLTDSAALASQLDTRWRNAGQWTLAARADTAEQAQAVVAAWSQAGREQLAAAAGHANQMLVLERRLQQTGSELTLVQAQQAVRQQANRALDDFESRLGEIEGSQPLPDLERWNLALIAGQAFGNDPATGDLLTVLPPPEASADQYGDYVEVVRAALDQRAASLEAREAALQVAYDELAASWQVEQQASQGISAYLTVEPLRQGEIRVLPQRNPGLAALVGGLIGLIAFLLYRLAVRSR